MVDGKSENIVAVSGSKAVVWAAWLMVGVLSTIILKTLGFLLVPLSIALLFVYALGVPLNLMKKLKVPNGLRIILVVGGILGVLYLLGRLVSINVREFHEQLPHFELMFWQYASQLLDFAGLTEPEAREIYTSFIDSFSQADFKPVGVLVKNISGSFLSFLGNSIWVVLFMAFIMAGSDGFSQKIIEAFGKKKAGPINDARERINTAVQHYLGLKTLISACTGFLVFVALLLLGVHFAMLWGVLAFLLNFIPNIGSLIAVLPPVAITLFQTGSFGKAIAVACVLTGIQLVVGNVVEPKVMGNGLNLSPLVVLLSLLFWGWVWGIPGMLLSVPLTAAFKIGMEQVEATKPLARMMSSR
ncbi:MAG: AI-2E family transporter [Desulfobulbaceae bacterium]|jgi:AI-2 transport protein TqsA|nr:AI-2E family transporter [Desulfobulbaceae bacterium]